MARDDENTRDDLDAPSPPGGPLRQDAPQTTVNPGGPSTPTQPGEPHPVDPGPEPEVHPSSPPDGPGTIPDPGPVPEPEPGPVEKNAETSEGQPSDGSGGE